MSYFLAASLNKLRDETNSRWPKRSKVSDGWIGDTSHQARRSDHNPDWNAPGKRRGVVRATDTTRQGIDIDTFLRHTTNDSRVAYVIYNRRIYQHSTGWKPYSGPNAHIQHVHVSIAHTNTAENDLKPWYGNSTVKPAQATKRPSRKKHVYAIRDEASIRRICIKATNGTKKNTTPHLIGLYQVAQIAPYDLVHDQYWGVLTDAHYRWVHALQIELNKWKGTKLKVTKVFDRATRARVIEWQKRNMGGAYKGTKADGVVGPLTIKPLGIKPYPN